MKFTPGNSFYAIIPFIQIVFFILGYDITNYVAHKMNMVYSRGVQWGISMNIYLVEYIAIIMMLSFLVYYFKKKALLFTIIAVVIFGIIIFPVLDVYPYRGGVVILIGTIGLFINYLFWLLFKPSHVNG